MAVLHVPTFKGIVLEGSADAQRSDELSACDGYDLSARGQLVAASDVTGWVNAVASGFAMTRIFGTTASPIPQDPILLVVGDRLIGGLPSVGAITQSTGAIATYTDAGAALVTANGNVVTFATFPFVDSAGIQRRVTLINIGARSGQNPTTAPGLMLYSVDSGGAATLDRIVKFDALGTGALGEYFIATGIAGTQSDQLYARGVFLYHGHAFIWGFDSASPNGDGPNRVMFSNIGNPLKWGLDPKKPADPQTNRAFEDSDAILIGGAGEAIRAAYVWAGKAWLATATGLHFIEGYGRESFMTNGAVPIRKSAGAIGAHALIEGPDGLLHGVDDTGHWVFNGSDTERVGNVLRDFGTHSAGYWDCIWTDSTSWLGGYPGTTNQDLVWMLSDPETMQVWIVIPFCNATTGGYGTDSVVLKYHTQTGGYTRQVFTGQILSAGCIVPREATATRRVIVATPGSALNVSRYALKATVSASPVLPTVLPSVTFGEYALYGPDGVGVFQNTELTVAWESNTLLDLVFTVTPTIDQQSLAAVKLSIRPTAPAAPASGDVWVDTSGTDTNLGNGTAGTIVGANPGNYLVKRYVAGWSKWVPVGDGGEQGKRVTVKLAWTAKKGSRVKLAVACTTASTRYQIEGLGFGPKPIRSQR